MDYQINLTKMIDALFEKKVVIIAVTIIVGVLSAIYTSGTAIDVYQGVSSIYAASEDSYLESKEGMNIIADYVDIIRSYKVAEHASSLMEDPIDPEWIQSTLSVTTNENSNIITVAARYPDSEIAVEISNAVSQAFVEQANLLTINESVQILDEAREAILISNGARDSLFMGVIITGGAFAVMCGMFMLLALFSNKVAYKNEVTLDGKLELLGVVPDGTKLK